MRRAHRLFQLVQILRRDRSTTGARPAQELGISLRTLYRDIADLQTSGVPIEGQARARGKLESGLTDGLKRALRDSVLEAPGFHVTEETKAPPGDLRRAVRERLRLELA